MKPEIKKLLILNLPYLLFVWLFDKVGAAVRLSPGADASAKLLHLGDGFTTAFSSIAPSFHPADLLIGIAGAVIVRLIIYTKGKNAKKYRRGTEYGSARWGGADDIKPYTDPVFENNIPLGSYHLLRRKSDFAKLTQKKNAATSKKITTLSKSCSVLSRTFLFALFFDFGNLFCRCGHNPYACIAHTVKKRVKLPPLRVLLRRRF